MYVQEMKGTRPWGRPRQKWKDNIEQNIKSICMFETRSARYQSQEEQGKTISFSYVYQ